MRVPIARTTHQATGRLGRFLGGLFLRLLGWRVEGAMPAGTKAIVIAAPHTTNWDMPIMIAVAYVLGVNPSWLGKKEIFRWPFGGFMRWLGGVPVDRSARQNIVQQVVELYGVSERLYVVIPPSATRRRAPHWKSGFYHIARGAGVPVMATFLDYSRKVGGIGPVFHPTGDMKADMDILRGFYAGVVGKYPELTTPVRLAEEGDDGAVIETATDPAVGAEPSSVSAPTGDEP